jgi:hypothetical protein
MRQVFHVLAPYHARGRDVSLPRQDVARQTAVLGEHRREQMARLDGLVPFRRGFRGKDDTAHARRHEDAVPQPIVARPERAPNVDEHVGRTHAALREASLDRRIVFFEECE